MSIYSETLNGRNGGGKGWGAVREQTEGRGLHDRDSYLSNSLWIYKE